MKPWLAAGFAGLLSACVGAPAVAPSASVPSGAPTAVPSAAASAAASPSASATPASPAAPTASPSPSPSASAVAATALKFGSMVRLTGGNGLKGDFNNVSDSGLPDKRYMDTAVAVVPSTGDTVFFLEGERGRVGSWSAPFVRQNADPYRVPNQVYTGLQRGGDMVAYKDGFLVSDTFGHRVFFIKKDGSRQEFAGRGTVGFGGDGGPAKDALLDSPIGLAVSSKGEVFIADSNNHVIRRVDTFGQISTFAGDPTVSADLGAFATGGKRLRIPSLLAVDKQDRIYVYDSRNQIRRVAEDKSFDLVAGSGTYEEDISSEFRAGVGLGKVLKMVVGPDGWLYYGDETNHSIRRINVSLPYSELRAERVVGSGKANGFPYYDGTPLDCTVSLPTAIGFDAKGGLHYFEGLTYRWVYLGPPQP